MTDGRDNVGKILKQRRVMLGLTQKELGHISGVSSSYLGRVEKGERFPSARVLRKVAMPLGFGETELFSQAGFLSKPLPVETEQLDPYVVTVLSQEPVTIQRLVLTILTVLKRARKYE